MTIIGPPDRSPDPLATGFRWCPECRVHQFPALIGQTILRNALGCPVCFDYESPIQRKAS